MTTSPLPKIDPTRPFSRPVCWHCVNLQQHDLPNTSRPGEEWGCDGLIEHPPLMPGDVVCGQTAREFFHSALAGLPEDCCLHAPQVDAGRPGSLDHQAEAYLHDWAAHDETFYLLLANEHWAPMVWRDIQTICLFVEHYLRKNDVTDHPRDDLREAIREIYEIAAALDLTRCKNNQDPEGPVGGVPALITAACAERLYARFPGLALIGFGDFLYWVAHLTIWCHLNGGFGSWIESLEDTGR